MEAIEGGGGKRAEPMHRLLTEVRENLDTTVAEKTELFLSPRSDVLLNLVLMRVRDAQRRAWLRRGVRTLFSMAETLWNSRAVRMLVP